MTQLRLAINAIPFAPGGGLTGLLGLLRGLSKFHADVSPVVFASKPTTIGALRDLDVSVVPVAIGKKLISRLYWQIADFDLELTRLRCDVLLSTNACVPSISIPQIVHHQNLWCFENLGMFDRPKDGFIKQLARQWTGYRAVREADYNVFVSEHLRQVAANVCSKAITNGRVIYNGLDDSQLHAARAGTNRWSGKPIICAVQPQVRQKDNDTLIRAFGLLVKRRPEVPWELRIAGGGDWSALQHLARSLGVDGRVRWLGHVERAGLDELFQESLCLMFTSYFESFGNPPIEAMSQGCPVIATNATAIPEVTDHAAILVERGDSNAFANAAISLWGDPAIRAKYVKAGHERAQHFDWTRCAGEFLQISRDLLHRLPRAASSRIGNSATAARGESSPSDIDPVIFHDHLAKTWEQKYRKPSFKWRQRLVAEAAKDYPMAGQVWLDAGCGTGRLARVLAEAGGIVHGVDASKEMLRFAQSSVRANGQSHALSFSQIRSIEKLPFADRSFDGILCMSVLEYVDDPLMALDEFSRVLKPGGRMLISVPNANSPIRKSLRLSSAVSRKLHGQPWPAYFHLSKHEFSTASFQSLLREFQFEPLSVTLFGGGAQKLVSRLRMLGSLMFVVAMRNPLPGS